MLWYETYLSRYLLSDLILALLLGWMEDGGFICLIFGGMMVWYIVYDLT